MNYNWLSYDNIKEMLKSIWPFTTFEQRKRLEALQREAEKGSEEISKQLYDEIHKIHGEQTRAFAQTSSSSHNLSKTPEINQFSPYSSSGTVVISNSWQHSQERPQYQSNYYQNPLASKTSKKPDANKAYMNALTTQSKIRAELASSSRQNYGMQQKYPRLMPSNSLPKPNRPTQTMEVDESNYDAEKFAREQEALRAENEKKLAQQKKEFETELLQNEQRFKKDLEAKTSFNAATHLPPQNLNPPAKVTPLPRLSMNVANFADDLAAISRRHRNSDLSNPQSEPYSKPTKSDGIDTEKQHSSVLKAIALPLKTAARNQSTKPLSVKKSDESSISSKIEIIPNNEKIKIGVIGLTGAGKSYLIAALTNTTLKHLDNKKCIDYEQNCTFFEINHPNYGFVANQPEAIKAKCKGYFDQIQVSNLTCLLNVINGDLREEDIFATQLALQAGVQVAIIRSKSDEWLDGSYRDTITSANKKAFSEKDKEYVHAIAKNVDEAVAACPLFNISALSLYNISTRSKRASIMQKYLIDEKSLIQYLENLGLHFDSLKNDILEAVNKDQDTNVHRNFQSSSKYSTDERKEKVDVLFVGRIGAGKSAIIDALRGIKESDENSATKIISCFIQNLQIAQFSYQEPTTFSQLAEQLKQYDLRQLKQIYLVIGDAVGELDVKLTKFFVDESLPVAILLTKTDLHIDNVTDRQGFEQHDLEEYYNHRKESAQVEIAKLVKNTVQLEIYVISSLVIRNLMTNTNKFLQYACDDQTFLSKWTTLL